MNLPVAPLAAVVLGVAAATAVAVMPAPTLEGLVSGSGIPAIFAAAQPPLGTTARLAIAGGSGLIVGLVTWFGLFVLLGTRGLSVAREEETETVRTVPVVRRADAHPDAPPRPPLLATRDLGTPFLEVTARDVIDEKEPEPLFQATHVVAPEAVPVQAFEQAQPVEPAPPVELRQPTEPVQPVEPRPPVEQDLPLDLDQPLSAYDPDAILESPMPPPVQIPPLRHAPRPAVFDANERFETFELTPIRRAPAPQPRPVPVSAPRQREEAITRPETEATIHALLERLERGVVRRGLATANAAPSPRQAERGLEDALVTLRNLARRAS
jgi:hypothetical protein